jgi:hypothetical protein
MKPVRCRQLGGWGVPKTVKNPRHLFQVTIFTSIDSWDDYVLAKDRKELDAWLEAAYPSGWVKGYEPTVMQLTGSLSMGSVFTTI